MRKQHRSEKLLLPSKVAANYNSLTSEVKENRRKVPAAHLVNVLKWWLDLCKLLDNRV